MRILGLIGSNRALGNTELMVTSIAKAAVEANETVSVRLLRLTDLRLNYCTGCMACAEYDAQCPLDDDMTFLMSEYEVSDAVILGAPAYTLLPPGPLKLIADRLIFQMSKSQWKVPKPAVTVGVASLPNWSDLLVPLLNCMLLGQGFRVVDSFLALGAGPGEVLLDERNVERSRLAGARLSEALQGEQVNQSVREGCCPVCGGDFFRITSSGLMCPLCLVPGELKNGIPVFDTPASHRWEPDAMRKHYTDWIQGTLERYIENRPEVRRQLRPFRTKEFPFVRPERRS
jgi:multimeric flavodoxin WrbA